MPCRGACPLRPQTVARMAVQDLAQPSWTVDLPEKIDAVVHLAQSPHFRNFPTQAEDIYGVSTGTTMKLLDWALRAGAKHFILGSTGGLYGVSKDPIAETAVLPNQRSQLGSFCDKACGRTARSAIFRPTLGCHASLLFHLRGDQSSSMLMPRLAASIRDGKPIGLQGDDGIHLNPVHVDDAVKAIVRVMDLKDSRLLNIAGPQVVTLREICAEIGRLLGRDPIFDVDMIAHPNHLVADIERMSRALGPPEIGIKAGIAELLGKS